MDGRAHFETETDVTLASASNAILIGFNVKPNAQAKKLAEQQKLYLIIASSDYIYGTNYQFCHGYLSKDLQNMTQEKMIQAFGRVGRQNSQMDYTLRIRDENLIRKLFLPEEFKMEVVNMNRLFCVE